MPAVNDIDRLQEEGARFSITTSKKGYVVRFGNYIHELTPQLETESLEEAVLWVRAHAALARATLAE